jgi:tetratricopeptide (TPR) repeat protein
MNILKMRFRLKSWAFVLSIIFFVFASGFANPLTDIERAHTLSRTDRETAIQILLDVNSRDDNNFIRIRDRLTTRQNYRLLMDFLRALPDSKRKAVELLRLSLITVRTNDLIDDINLYLEFDDVSSISDNFHSLVVNPEITAFLESRITNRDIFIILRDSHSKSRRFARFDLILEKHSPLSESNEVLRYITESFRAEKRDLKRILDIYNFERSPVISGIYLYSLFVQGDYQNLLDYYESNTEFFDYEILKRYEIDLPYILGRSYFALGDYKKSLDFYVRTFFPRKYDIAEYSLLCDLGMGDYRSAKGMIGSVKNSDRAKFYSSFLDLLEGNTNRGIRLLEEYIVNISSDTDFLLEAGLIAYTFYQTPSDLEYTLNAVRNSILQKQISDSVRVSLSSAFVVEKGGIVSEVSDLGSVFDFVLYKRSLDFINEGKIEEAKKILLEILQNPKSSQLIRSLSIYRLRGIS